MTTNSTDSSMRGCLIWLAAAVLVAVLVLGAVFAAGYFAHGMHIAQLQPDKCADAGTDMLFALLITKVEIARSALAATEKETT